MCVGPHTNRVTVITMNILTQLKIFSSAVCVCVCVCACVQACLLCLKCECVHISCTSLLPLQRVVDGGFSDNIPHAKDIDGVITVSPFPGDFDICPEEDHHHNMKHFFHVANMELQFNMHNWWRIKQCLFSPSMSELRDIQREGYRDTLRFLKTRGEGQHTPLHKHTSAHMTHTHLHTCTEQHTYTCMCMCALVCGTCKWGYLLIQQWKVQIHHFVCYLTLPNFAQVCVFV